MPPPSLPGSSKDMDAYIWNMGAQNARKLGNPHELDFLRGFHDKPTLTVLRDWLQAKSSKKIRLTSVWLDKYGNVVPSSRPHGQRYKYQELADLAVIVRDSQNSQANAWMWLLQAKVVDNSKSKLPSSKSTDREIHLYEKMPDFTWHGKHSKGHTFRLKKDFSSSVEYYKHWSFLCFQEDYWAQPNDKFIDVRWPGSLHPSGLAVTSFSDELVELISNFSASNVSQNVYGAPLIPGSEWNELAEQILHKTKSIPKSGHASKVKGQKSDVLVCAMLAEKNVDCHVLGDEHAQDCYPDHFSHLFGLHLEGFPYSAVSTGFNGYEPKFNLSELMHERLSLNRGVLRDGNGNNGREPPQDSNQGDGDDDGSGAKLTLFVDVGAEYSGG